MAARRSPHGFVQRIGFQADRRARAGSGEGKVLVRNLYLSLDPTNRGWASMDTYLPAVAIGDVMRGIGIGAVEKSRHSKFQEGNIVQGMLGWQQYALSDGAGLTVLPKNPNIPLTAYFGLFGHIGLTAYYGLLDVGRPKAGETLVVTAAAGAVGSIAGQIGKIKGCRVVGIAGSDEKCRWITQDLGFDAAVNYKKEPVLESLKKHCPNGIDIDFENVGGEILDNVLALINLKGRIVLCGLISQYNADRPVPGPYNFANILVRRARVEGFIVLDYLDRAQEAMTELGKWLMEGRIKYRVEVIEGIEQAPRAVNKLFDGSHQGKLIIKL